VKQAVVPPCSLANVLLLGSKVVGAQQLAGEVAHAFQRSDLFAVVD
jgi:hypothetical protein